MLTAGKTGLTILMKFSGKGVVGKIFERKMLIKLLPPTLHDAMCNKMPVSTSIRNWPLAKITLGIPRRGKYSN